MSVSHSVRIVVGVQVQLHEILDTKPQIVSCTHSPLLSDTFCSICGTRVRIGEVSGRFKSAKLAYALGWEPMDRMDLSEFTDGHSRSKDLQLMDLRCSDDDVPLYILGLYLARISCDERHYSSGKWETFKADHSEIAGLCEDAGRLIESALGERRAVALHVLPSVG